MAIQFRPLDTEFRKQYMSNPKVTFKPNEYMIPYIKYSLNISIINTLVNHPNREAAAKYIDFSYPDPIESARRDPILAERMVGELTNECFENAKFVDGKFQSEPTIEAVTEVAKTIIESEYRDMYPVASDRLIESFIPIALARFFNFNYEQYISCYHKTSLGRMSPFLDPPLLEAY